METVLKTTHSGKSLLLVLPKKVFQMRVTSALLCALKLYQSSCTSQQRGTI